MAFPTREQVIESCKIDYDKQQGKMNHILCPGDNGSPLYYIKYGPAITMGQTINQRYFFDTYIVMEYIHSCGFVSPKQIADAVALLLGVDPPANSKPGPAEGGLMHHPLFKDRTDICY